MDLETATEAFEEHFPDVTSSKTVNDGDRDHPVVWSGDVVDWMDVAPCLYDSEERAIKAWLETARSLLPKNKTKLEWLLLPELCNFQTTMTDRKQRERVVSDRYAVKSQFTVNGQKING